MQSTKLLDATGGIGTVLFTRDATVPNRGLRAVNRFFFEKMQSPERWTSAEVAANLWQIGLGRYAKAFVENEVNGKNLFSVTVRMLQQWGVTATHRQTFFEWVHSLPHPRHQPKPSEATVTLHPRPEQKGNDNPAETRLLSGSLIASWRFEKDEEKRKERETQREKEKKEKKEKQKERQKKK
jgi:hypothetical protein